MKIEKETKKHLTDGQLKRLLACVGCELRALVVLRHLTQRCVPELLALRKAEVNPRLGETVRLLLSHSPSRRWEAIEPAAQLFPLLACLGPAFQSRLEKESAVAGLATSFGALEAQVASMFRDDPHSLSAVAGAAGVLPGTPSRRALG